MPVLHTKFHGTVEYDVSQVLEVSQGLFGFRDETEYLLLELPSSRPLVFIQSVRSQNLCFLSLPAQVIDSNYRLSMQPHDLRAFGFSEHAPPTLGKDVLCLAILTVGEKGETSANLAAPLIVNIKAHRGIQAVAGSYSTSHPLPQQEVLRSC